MEEKKGYISEWRPFSELRPVSRNISNLGYTKEYIEEHLVNETKLPHWTNTITGVINFYEPFEIKVENGTVFYRENETLKHKHEPESFKTQFGTFDNHNHGEFFSWLSKEGYRGLPEKERRIHEVFGRHDFLVEGNFCDMFDCGAYVFGISNLMHMGSGDFKIIRVDEQMDVRTVYDNSKWGFYDSSLEYMWRYEKDDSHFVIISGLIWEKPKEGGSQKYDDTTILIRIDTEGNCCVDKDWETRLKAGNSYVVIDDSLYIGQNKMVTRFDFSTGKAEYFTNKSDEELTALVEVFF